MNKARSLFVKVIVALLAQRKVTNVDECNDFQQKEEDSAHGMHKRVSQLGMNSVGGRSLLLHSCLLSVSKLQTIT